MFQEFNPLSFKDDAAFPIDGNGVAVMKVYQLVLVQNATSVEHCHKTRRVKPLPLRPLAQRDAFMRSVQEIACNHKAYKQHLAKEYGINRDALLIASASLAFRFGEIREYNDPRIADGVAARIETINPSLYFVGALSTVDEQLDDLEAGRDKNNTTQTHTDNWKTILQENLPWAFVRAGIDAVVPDLRPSYSSLPVVVDTLNRAHVPLEGDCLLSRQTGDVVWWLNHYVDVSTHSAKAYRADQTFVIGSGADVQALRSIDIPAFVKDRHIWP